MVFQCSLSDSKSPQVSRILHGILADLNNTVVGIVFTHSLICKFFSPFIKHLVTVPRAPMTRGITTTFIFDWFFFFNSLARSTYLSFFSLSVNFILWPAGTVTSINRQVLFFLLIIARSVRLAEIWWSFFIWKFQRSLGVSFFRIDTRFYLCYLSISSILAQFPVDPLPHSVLSSFILFLC